MEKPEVTLENYNAVYNFYRMYRQPRLGAAIGHGAMALAFKPDMTYKGSADDLIRDHLRDGSRLIIALNHISDKDQYVVAAMARREQAFQPMVGNTFIQSKVPLFHHPNKLVRPLLRHGVDVMGAIPAFRKKDSDGQSDELRKAATSELLETSVAKMQQGQHMAVFPEGTRNKENPNVVQPLKEGIIYVASKVAAEHVVAVVPIGFTYDSRPRYPEMVVAEPIVDYEFSANTFLLELRDIMQECVDQAIRQSANPRHS